MTTRKKPDPRPSIPGKICPNCDGILMDPDPGDQGTYPGWDKWENVPHENPFDCIRTLRKALDSIKSDLKYELEDVRNDLAYLRLKI